MIARDRLTTQSDEYINTRAKESQFSRRNDKIHANVLLFPINVINEIIVFVLCIHIYVAIFKTDLPNFFSHIFHSYDIY